MGILGNNFRWPCAAYIAAFVMANITFSLALEFSVDPRFRIFSASNDSNPVVLGVLIRSDSIGAYKEQSREANLQISAGPDSVTKPIYRYTFHVKDVLWGKFGTKRLSTIGRKSRLNDRDRKDDSLIIFLACPMCDSVSYVCDLSEYRRSTPVKPKRAFEIVKIIEANRDTVFANQDENHLAELYRITKTAKPGDRWREIDGQWQLIKPAEYGAGFSATKEEAAEEGLETYIKCKKLAGFDSLLTRFSLGNQPVEGFINLQPYSIFIMLKRRENNIPNSAWWWNPIVDGQPQNNWFDFMAVFSKAEKAVIKQPWLEHWVKREGNREVEAQIVGTRPNSLDAVDSARANKVWKHGKMKGSVPIQLLLRIRGNSSATVLLNQEDERTIVMVAGGDSYDNRQTPKQPVSGKDIANCLDTLSIFYDTDDKIPNYAIVNADGSWHLNSRPK